jgi:asparagine synthase (glutamine-hydrolysing)
MVTRFSADIDQPSTDGLNTWIVSRAAARDVKGVLSGLGGDEWFSGYPVVGRMARRARSSRGRVLGHLASAASLTRLSTTRLDQLRTWESALTLWFGSRTVFSQRQLAAISIDPIPPAEELLKPALGRISPSEDAVDLATRLDSRVYMQCQLLRDSDATSMASSLELRVPFVDTHIAASARSCPPQYKLDPHAQPPAKRILVRALENLLPPELLQRPKRGFAMPYVSWLEGPLKELEASVRPFESLVRRGFVTQPREPLRFSLHPQRWSLLLLELWAREVLDRPIPEFRPSAPAASMTHPAAAEIAAT